MAMDISLLSPVRLSPWITSVLLAILLILGYTQVRNFQYRKRSQNLALPPGPKGWPIIGVTAEMLDPMVRPWMRLEAWRQEYHKAPFLHVPTLRRTNFVVSSVEVAQELFEKRGRIYSGRPHSMFEAEMVFGGMALVTKSDQAKVTHHRKMLMEQLNTNAIAQCEDTQVEEIKIMIHRLLAEPGQHEEVIRTSMQNLVFKTLYGDPSPETLHHLRQFRARSDQFMPPPIAPLLDLFPLLRHLSKLPFSPFDFSRRAHDQAITYQNTFKILLDDVRSQVRKGDARSSLASRMLENKSFERYGFSPTESDYVCGTLLAASLAPQLTLKVFLVAMLTFPNILKRAQEEIDRVVGRGRMPTLLDKNDLPFTRAIVLEVQRWRPVSPLPEPHVLTQDDFYDGYFLPKGSVIWPSLWAMSRDTSFYPDPEAFYPERFLSEDGTTISRKLELPIFGFGRRYCPALHFSHATLFLAIASMIWALDMKSGQTLPDIDISHWENGFNVSVQSLLPSQSSGQLIFRGPLPFEASITSRGSEVETLCA